MLLLTVLTLSLLGSFWYRVSRADATADFRRIRAMCQYVATSFCVIPAGYIVLDLYSVPLDLEVLSANMLLMMLAATVLPKFDVRVVATLGSLIVLLDPNNHLSTSLVILIAFLIAVLAGSSLGAALFRQLFERRMQSATGNGQHPAGG